MNKAAGFTLIELMIVIAVIAILATISLFGLGFAQMKARDAQRYQNMKGVQLALERFKSDKGSYPRDQMAGTSCNTGTWVYILSALGLLQSEGYYNLNQFKDPAYGVYFDTSQPQNPDCTYPVIGGGAWYEDIGCPLSATPLLKWGTPVRYAYGYNGSDGSYTLCLKGESGGTTIFRSPV